MAAIREWLQGRKTYFLVIFGFLAALVSFLAGDLTLLQFLASPEFLGLLGLLGLGTIGARITRLLQK